MWLPEAKTFLSYMTPMTRDRCIMSKPAWILVIVALCGIVACEGNGDVASKALRDYESGAFRASVEAYRQALDRVAERHPQRPALRYNLGAALYRAGELQEAVDALTEAGVGSPSPENQASSIQFRALYNGGNAHFRRGHYDDAVHAYRRALQLNPSDVASKHNLEVALEERLRQQSAGGARDEDTRQATPEPGVGEPTPVPQMPVGMSADEARRLLDMLGDDDLSAQRRRLRQLVPPQTSTENDW